MKRNNYKNDYLHCPECLHQSLFGIKIKNNNSYIQYKCRQNHIGEIPISKFLKENDDTSIYSLICQYCKKKNTFFNLYYCYECSSFCPQFDCGLKHLSKNHKEEIHIEDFDNICPKHLKMYLYYCEKCKIPLCEKCPTLHKKHGLKTFGKLKEEKIKELENKIDEIEKIRNDIIMKIQNWILDLQNKLNEYKNKTQLELNFVKDILYSYKLNEFKSNEYKIIMNYEVIENLKNIKFNKINLDDLKDYSSFLLKNESILDNNEINLKEEDEIGPIFQ
jgi:hypothetical protein